MLSLMTRLLLPGSFKVMKIQAEIHVATKTGQNALFALISLHLQNLMHIFKHKLCIK